MSGTIYGPGDARAIHGIGWPPPTSRCRFCDREIEVFRHPDLGLVLLGHRVEMPHTPETRWCQGGGRRVVDREES